MNLYIAYLTPGWHRPSNPYIGVYETRGEAQVANRVFYLYDITTYAKDVGLKHLRENNVDRRTMEQIEKWLDCSPGDWWELASKTSIKAMNDATNMLTSCRTEYVYPSDGIDEVEVGAI
jgi:hypothetical protein